MTADRTIEERVEELLSAEALGGLDADGVRELERLLTEHGDRADVAAMRSDYAEVAGRLASALSPVVLRDGFEDQVLAAALAERPAAPGTTAAPPTASAARPVSPASLEDRRAARTGGRWKALVAVAAAFSLFAGGWLVADLTRSDPDAPDAVDIAAARVVSFDSQEGTLAVAYEPGERGAYVIGSDLPTASELGANKVYEVWMIQDGKAVPGPCIAPPADGSLFEYADVELGTSEAMAVTVESDTCPAQPTTDPVATASLV